MGTRVAGTAAGLGPRQVVEAGRVRAGRGREGRRGRGGARRQLTAEEGRGAGIGAGPGEGGWPPLNAYLSKSDSEAAGPLAGSRCREQGGSITVGIVNRWEFTEPGLDWTPSARGRQRRGARGPGGAGQ